MVANALVIGDAMLDVHVAPSLPVRPGGDVPASIRLAAGGQGANLAVRLARRGAAVRLACALGDDEGGRLLRAALAADRVKVSQIGAGTATGVVVVLREPDAGRTMLSQRAPLLGSALAVALEAVEPEPDGWLIISGYVLLEAGSALARIADSWCRAVIGCSLSSHQAAAWAAVATALRPHLAVVNLDEARTICGSVDDPSRLVPWVRRATGSEIAVVTHPGGAVAVAGDALVAVAAPAVGALVDTTGAGDAFAAALVAGLSGGSWPPATENLDRAMTAATAVASAVARTPGAQGWVDGESREGPT
jgi:sugar/nucleoside kinase (ribokinase family)